MNSTNHTDRSGSILVPSSHAVFKDHFPDYPIVPGAMLVDWIVCRLQEKHPQFEAFRIATLKFLHPVYPGEELFLNLGEVTEKESALRIEVKLSHHEKIVVSGIFESCIGHNRR